MKKARIKVYYSAFDCDNDEWAKIRKRVDSVIESAMKEFGFGFTGSGYDLRTDTRDICFEKKE
jgi:hypothetical protein